EHEDAVVLSSQVGDGDSHGTDLRHRLAPCERSPIELLDAARSAPLEPGHRAVILDPDDQLSASAKRPGSLSSNGSCMCVS
ncbi:MAG: hypothetical protein LKI31_04280, partial [Olsenella sp.]|nr:hypothetical protein [Olsenella sp.]